MDFEALQKLIQSCYVVFKPRTIKIPGAHAQGCDDPSTNEKVVEIIQVTPHELKNMAEKDPKIVAFELRPITVKLETTITTSDGDKL